MIRDFEIFSLYIYIEFVDSNGNFTGLYHFYETFYRNSRSENLETWSTKNKRNGKVGKLLLLFNVLSISETFLELN